MLVIELSSLLKGLSLELAVCPFFVMPLFSHHDCIALSLTSVYFLFFLRNKSSQSNRPSSGRPTGHKTSYFPSLGFSGVGAISASACSAAPIMRHWNGKGSSG